MTDPTTFNAPPPRRHYQPEAAHAATEIGSPPSKREPDTSMEMLGGALALLIAIVGLVGFIAVFF